MLFVLSLKETEFIKTNWNIDKSEISLSLSVGIKGGFWVHINRNALLLGLEEILFTNLV